MKQLANNLGEQMQISGLITILPDYNQLFGPVAIEISPENHRISSQKRQKNRLRHTYCTRHRHTAAFFNSCKKLPLQFHSLFIASPFAFEEWTHVSSQGDPRLDWSDILWLCIYNPRVLAVFCFTEAWIIGQMTHFQPAMDDYMVSKDERPDILSRIYDDHPLDINFDLENSFALLSTSQDHSLHPVKATVNVESLVNRMAIPNKVVVSKVEVEQSSYQIKLNGTWRPDNFHIFVPKTPTRSESGR
jgi:hypothetical protein